MEHCHDAFEQMGVVEMFQLQSVTAEVTGEGGEGEGRVCACSACSCVESKYDLFEVIMYVCEAPNCPPAWIAALLKGSQIDLQHLLYLCCALRI